MLERGGNAVDAAAAIQFVLNVVEPQFSGIGGGGFMMVHLAKTNQTFAIDGREKAPATATPTMFLFTGVPASQLFGLASTSGIAVGVPGTLKVIDTALKNYGTISLGDAMQSAIEIADNGFHINQFLAANILNDGGITSLQPETAAIFRPGGVPLKEGDLLVRKDLAATFRLIAQKGPDVFYKGAIAQAIVDAVKRSRSPVASEGLGRMTLADLANYNTLIRQPITVTYRGYQLASMSPPSSGGLSVGQMLLELQRFPLGDSAQGFGFGATKTLHAMIEAMRLTFADRAVWMGDEDFVHVPKKGLLDPTYVASRSAMIKLDSRMATPAAGNPLPFDMAGLDTKVRLAAIPFEEEKGVHTTHFSVVDKWGNIVSWTTTIEQTWGTGITVPGYGFLLNNELTDFNFVPTFNAATGNPGANDVAPNKRPRSSMSPSILFRKDEPIAAYGSPGGLDHHQFGAERYAEPDRSRHDDPAGDRCAEALGDERRGNDLVRRRPAVHRSGVLDRRAGRVACAGPPRPRRGGDQRLLDTDRLGPGCRYRPADRQAIWWRGSASRRDGDRPATATGEVRGSKGK